MRFMNLIYFAVTALLTLSTCAASLSSSCSPSLTTAIPNTTGSVLDTTSCDCPASEIAKPVNIAALLPKISIFEDYDRLVSRVAQVSEFARTADDIHLRYFVLGSVTKGLPIALNGQTYHLIQRIGTELLKLSSLQNLEVLTKSAPGPLPSLQAHYAQGVINKYETDGVLDADRTLVFHAAELWSLTHASKATWDAWRSRWNFGSAFPNLQKDIALALQTDSMSSLQVLRIRALLEEHLELQEHISRWYLGPYGLSEAMANRANNVLTVIRCGYAHEPGPVLQLMREMVARGGEQPVSKTAEAAAGQTPDRAWYESMSERLQRVKGFMGW
ncbi:hypothetical protein LTR15_003401 [Elasticomyces elasticus]|nr:hypothetical protein LTR15_003401 [Elasticomyces elasticus]